MKLLFICSQNRRRSLTAEHLFDEVGGHLARSAGTEEGAYPRDARPSRLGRRDLCDGKTPPGAAAREVPSGARWKAYGLSSYRG